MNPHMGLGREAGELWEVVRGVEALGSFLPIVAVHEVVPVWNEVAQRTPAIAERDTAVHAARGLTGELFSIEWFVDLFPIEDSNRNRPHRRRLSIVIHETSWITHDGHLALVRRP